MAKEHLKAHQFPKGTSGNPKGRPKDPPEMAKLKNLTAEELVEVGSCILKGNLTDLQAITKDPASSALKVWIASVAITAIKKGDAYSLDVVLNRLVGKAKAQVEHSGSVDVPQAAQTVIFNIPNNFRDPMGDDDD